MGDTPFTLDGIDHLAIATNDLKGTLGFFCDVLDLPLGGLFWMHGVEGAVHAFLPFPDGRTLSFIRFAEQRPRQAGVSYATWPGDPMPAGAMQHVALQVASRAELDRARERIKASGVKVSHPIDHGFCTSIYLAGPDDLQLEITHQVRPLDEREFDQSAADRCGISAEELAHLAGRG